MTGLFCANKNEVTLSKDIIVGREVSVTCGSIKISISKFTFHCV
jgi:hypothetical protein